MAEPPTPIQARVLRLLVKWPGTVFRRRRGTCEIDGPNRDYYHDREAHQAFRADIAGVTGHRRSVTTASLMAMERAGWVRRREDQWAESYPTFELTDHGRVAERLLEPSDLVDRPKHNGPPVMSTKFMLDAIRGRWAPEDGWCWFVEWNPGCSSGRRLDAAAINRWHTRGYATMAFELKRSRQDFLKELAEPAKREEALAISSLFWFVTPEGLVKPEEVPPEAGLAWVTVDGAVRIRRKPPERPRPEATWDRIGAILRSLAVNGILPAAPQDETTAGPTASPVAAGVTVDDGS